MKKILLIIIFIFIAVPTISYAGCTNCGVVGGGDGSSGASAARCGGWCAPSQSRKLGGVRINLYVYDPKNNVGPTKIGSSFDILPTGFQSPTYYSSQRNNDPVNERKGANCAISKRKIMNNTVTWLNWKNNKNSINYMVDSNIWSKIYSGTVGNYLYNVDSKQGKLKEILFDPMIKGDYNAVGKLFGVSGSTISKQTGNMYITAELLMGTFWLSTGNGIYLGTVGEIYPNLIYTPYMDHLYVASYRAPIGNMVNNILRSTSKNKPSTSVFYTSHNKGFATGSKRTDICQQTWGMAVWYLPDCCPKCIRSCSQSCDEKYQKGTFQHQMCAQGYCNSEGKDDVQGCLKECTTIDEKEGCNGECKLGSTTATDRVCSPETDKDGFEDKIEMNSCHDDSTKYNVVDKNVNYSNDGKYTYSTMNYYRITCDETVTFKDLPKMNATSWLNKMNSGNLHLGFTLNYGKKCSIQYKTGSKGKYNWQDKFEGSRLENDINDTVKAINTSNQILADLENKKKTEKNTAALEDIEKDIIVYKKVIEVAEQTKKELLALAPTTFKIGSESGGGVIDARLIVLTQLDHKGEKYFEPTIELEVPDISVEANINGSINTTTDYLVLEPVTCVEVPQQEITHCVWREDEKKYYVKYETNTLLECDNVDSNGNAIPIKAKVAGNKYSASVEKTLYYELPDSYVLTQSEDDGLVFHSTYKQGTNLNIETAKQKCNDYLRDKDYTGKCLKEDNLYQFPQFEDKLIVDELTTTNKKLKYEIKINNIGYCGEKLNGYNYSCSYQFKEDTECSKCSQYAKGTAAYEDCYNKNCSCEAVCNGSVSCEQKYCPTTCVSCGETTYYEDEDCDDDDDDGGGGECDSSKNDCCNENCSKNSVAGSDTFYACQYECCNSKANGNIQAITDCCHKYCTNIARGSNEKYNECVDVWCPKCPECEGGTEYVYRSINIRDPFNGRENQTDGVGLNWRGKIGFITEENNNKNKQYYDSTNSYDKDESTAEYVFDLSSEMLKDIKETRKIGSESVDTTYQLTKSSKETNSKISSTVNDSDVVEPYCSYLLHDVFETNGSLKQNDAAGMRCK